MIDRPARTQLALACRRMASGRVNSRHFERWIFRIPDHDPVIRFVIGLFSDLYDFWSTVRLRSGREFDRRWRRWFARIVLFVRADKYVPPATRIGWPASRRSEPTGLHDVVLFELGCERRQRMKFATSQRQLGPARRIWSFVSQADLDAARSRPVFLCGHAA